MLYFAHFANNNHFIKCVEDYEIFFSKSAHFFHVHVVWLLCTWIAIAIGLHQLVIKCYCTFSERSCALSLFTFITHEIYLSIINDFSYRHVWLYVHYWILLLDLVLSWSSLIKWHTFSWLLNMFRTRALNIIIHEFLLQMDTSKINVCD